VTSSADHCAVENDKRSVAGGRDVSAGRGSSVSVKPPRPSNPESLFHMKCRVYATRMGHRNVGFENQQLPRRAEDARHGHFLVSNHSG